MARLSLRLRNDGRRFDAPPTVCCISREGTDRLQVIGFTENLLAPFRIAVQTSWGKGIQSEGAFGSYAYQFKLKGNPWSRGDRESADSCRLVIGIMRFMLSHGWRLEIDMVVHQRHGMTSWFFNKHRQETHVVMCGISFKGNDRIRVIDGDSKVIETVKNAIKHQWHQGLQKENPNQNCDAHEFKLKGFPWIRTSTDKMWANTFLMHMMSSLRSQGWKVYAVVDLSATSGMSQNGPGMDSWILKKVKDAVPHVSQS